MKKKIKHWLIIDGNPILAGKTRKEARKYLREQRGQKKNQFLYIGKCVANVDGKHATLVFDI